MTVLVKDRTALINKMTAMGYVYGKDYTLTPITHS